MAADDTSQGVELAMLRGEVMTTLARIEGAISLVRQAQEDSARRTDDLSRDVRRLDDRVDAHDRTFVSREDMNQAVAQVREDADKAVEQVREEAKQQQERHAEQQRRSLMIWALVISVIAAGLTGAGFVFN